MEAASEDFLMFNDVAAEAEHCWQWGGKMRYFSIHAAVRRDRREGKKIDFAPFSSPSQKSGSEWKREIYIFFIRVRSAWGWLIEDSEKMSFILNPWVILWINNFQSVVCIASSIEHLLRTLNLNRVCCVVGSKKKPRHDKNFEWLVFEIEVDCDSDSPLRTVDDDGNVVILFMVLSSASMRRNYAKSRMVSTARALVPSLLLIRASKSAAQQFSHNSILFSIFIHSVVKYYMAEAEVSWVCTNSMAVLFLTLSYFFVVAFQIVV